MLSLFRKSVTLSTEDGEMHIALRMCFEIDEERIGTRGRTVQTIVEHAIRKEGAEVVVARIEFLVQVAHHRIELSGELLRVGQRGVHAIHRLLHIHLRQIARKLFGFAPVRCKEAINCGTSRAIRRSS